MSPYKTLYTLVSLQFISQGKIKSKTFGRRFSSLTWPVVAVKNGEREEGSVAMGSEGGLGQGRHVVHVVETWAVCVIVARQQQVHMIWSLARGEGGAREGGERRINICCFLLQKKGV